MMIICTSISNDTNYLIHIWFDALIKYLLTASFLVNKVSFKYLHYNYECSTHCNTDCTNHSPIHTYNKWNRSIRLNSRHSNKCYVSMRDKFITVPTN